jgi:hypothetical protein
MTRKEVSDALRERASSGQTFESIGPEWMAASQPVGSSAAIADKAERSSKRLGEAAD